jgi:hypothetical protein
MSQQDPGVGPRIGVVSSTAHTPTTTEQFSINLDRGQVVKRFDIVTVQTEDAARTHGVITEIVNATEAPTHLANHMDADLLAYEGETQSKIFQVTTATASVLSNTVGRDMPVPHGISVSLATSQGIHEALGIYQRMTEVPAHMIPVGFIRQSNDMRTVVCIDRRFLLGDEAAHLNASGISGLATKTSYLLFMAQSILQHEARLGDAQTGVIILNSKKADLLRLHEPRLDLRPADIADWEGLGLQASPFTNVQYFLPRGFKGMANSFPPFPPHRLYAYTLEGAAPFLDLLFSNVTNESGTIQSTLSEIRETLANPQDVEYGQLNTWHNLVTFLGSKQSGTWRGVQSRSLQMVLRLLRRMLVGTGRGLFVEALAATIECLPYDILTSFRAGDVYVFDIANLRERERGLVVGSLLRAIEHLKSDSEHVKLFPPKVIIYLDELGKYAPKGADNALVDDFIDIAERGRSSGEILFGAEQSRNAVNDRIIGTIGNSVIGMTGSAELGGVGYASLAPQIKTTIPRLVQGEMIFIHPVFRLPVKINFPKPAWE